MNLIEFENVDFTYTTDNGDSVSKEVEVIKNLNLKIEKGSFVAVLGHNGSGKSTICKAYKRYSLSSKG